MTGRFDPGELGAPATPWRAMLLLSLGLHAFGFAMAVGLPRLVPRPAFNPVYVVDLVTLPGGPANASPPAPAPAANPPAARPPREEKAIKIPDKDRKKPEPKKTPAPKSTPARPQPAETPMETAPPRPTPASAAAPADPRGTPSQGASMSGVSGGAGAAGGGFGGSGAAAADALTFYYSLVQRNIENAWKKPIYPPTETSRRTFTTQIRLVLTSSGRVSSVEVLAPSGYDAMDRSILDAVHGAMFPPFPSSVSQPSLTIVVEIVLTKD